MAGDSPQWRKLLHQAELVAPHVQTATIEGESGTGKQTLARYLHARSHVARAPFLRRDAREWLVTDGDISLVNGLLFLDRVDLLADPGQRLLLGVLKALQDRCLGRAIIIASSQVYLRQLASQGQILPDLAFRLTAVRLCIPPLRERREDIAPLTRSLLGRICARYQQEAASLEQGALARLLQHSWPGNVRELESVLEAAVLEAPSGVIRAEDLFIPSIDAREASTPLALAARDLVLDGIIQNHVKHVLELNRGNKLRAARQLGISRSTLYRILSDKAILAR